MNTKQDIAVIYGATSVFAEHGYPNAAERQTKTCLALAGNNLLKARKLASSFRRELRSLMRLAASGSPARAPLCWSPPCCAIRCCK